MCVDFYGVNLANQSLLVPTVYKLAYSQANAGKTKYKTRTAIAVAVSTTGNRKATSDVREWSDRVAVSVNFGKTSLPTLAFVRCFRLTQTGNSTRCKKAALERRPEVNRRMASPTDSAKNVISGTTGHGVRPTLRRHI